ncbi:acid sphingomyelinase-like phosphodiesterase [Legionella beliardensis]|uniref:Acid sphingomyelinase-like phosphodiesterase n=1 Tax=Legionella beliardensis TaxID=91822 RepID=A0A378HZQ4_9GAMM|nr:metallophosphoesterase [Legionella beliardensis]STX28409.1 acid sphingomyelinase-like phosphodiesterase [Legionella beliardensis]
MNTLLKNIIGLIALICSSYAWPALHFLTIADIHYGSNNTIGNGHDTGDVLWTTTLKKLHELQRQVDFSIVLGDLPTHSLPLLSNKTQKAQYEAKVFQDLYKANSQHKPIFYVPGNNDSLTGNYQPFAKNGSSPLDYAYNWQGACAYCQELIIDKTAMHSDGYYSSYVLPNNKEVLLIVLNTTQFAKLPWLAMPYVKQSRDANRQLKWLESQLKNNKAKQLLIAMHEEPGVDYHKQAIWQENYLQAFIKLLNNYQQNYQQISLLTAHSHYDELRKITLTNGKPIYAYATPAISRSHYNNPAMKVFHLNDEFYLQDFTTHYSLNESQWTNHYYHAIAAENDAIFSTCAGLPLAACLDTLPTEKLCDLMEGKFIYSTKNQDKTGFNCLNTYNIN